MGVAKATLPFGGEPMLARVVRLLSEVVRPIVVVGAPGQAIAAMPAEILIAFDRRENRGPLEGLGAGLEALGDSVEAVYATSCDVPLLTPAVVRKMIERLGRHEIAVPVDGKFTHPLAAVYRTSVRDKVAALLAEDRLRTSDLLGRCDTLCVPVDELRQVDPELLTLANLNRPEDYFAALARAGFEPDPEVARRLG
jgi:molybdopterin-guanine dinucleotide biosynthesis protein A